MMKLSFTSYYRFFIKHTSRMDVNIYVPLFVLTYNSIHTFTSNTSKTEKKNHFIENEFTIGPSKNHQNNWFHNWWNLLHIISSRKYIVQKKVEVQQSKQCQKKKQQLYNMMLRNLYVETTVYHSIFQIACIGIGFILWSNWSIKRSLFFME